jgi:Tfp pilus assembly protein PilN
LCAGSIEHDSSVSAHMSTLAPDVEAVTVTDSRALPFWRRALVFGTGFGIAIGERNLEAAIVRARPSGVTPIATATIHDFRNRPAAEWGAELLRFVTAAGESRLAATVLLPRNEVVVRTVSLPGVADKDAANAVELQIDTLHPWSDTGGRDVEVAWGWSRASKGDVIVGLARKELLDSYETIFAEAGILMAAATFSTAVIHTALRIWSEAPASLLCINTDDNGHIEIYGESDSRAAFSAEFSVTRERAIALARAELRIASDQPARALSEVLPPAPGKALQGNPLAWAAAIAGSAPRVTHFANLLPPERRASHDRMQYLVPAILGILLVLALLAVFVIFPAVEQKRYREDLDRAARQLEPAAARAQAMERKIKEDGNRILLLDDIRRRPQADLEVLNELTRLLPPPVWTSSIEIYPDSVVISGEADQAAPLLKILDSSPLFQNSEFALSLTRGALTEQFRIKTMRRGRVGRTTP